MTMDISVREARAMWDEGLTEGQKEAIVVLFGTDYKCFGHPEAQCDKLNDPICRQCKLNQKER